VQRGSHSFAYSLGSSAAATITWTGTQTGASTLSATSPIQASSFNAVFNLRTEPSSDTLGGYDLSYAANNSYAVYPNVDFAAGFASVSARLASAGSGGGLEFRLDSPTGPLVGSVTIPVTGGWQTWQTVTGPTFAAGGLHNLYAVFRGTTSIGNLNWVQFSGPPQPLPTPWTSADIGAVGLGGGAACSGGTFSLSGSGADIWNSADAFRFVQQSASGACEIRARVVSLQNTDPWAKAGVMLRGSAAAGAVNAAVLVTSSNGVTFQVRASTGGTSSSTAVGGVGAPRWVRLVRSAANSFAGYYSADGTTWTQIGSSAT
jgi:hypothetical protein